jgi:hypothetical protein
MSNVEEALQATHLQKFMDKFPTLSWFASECIIFSNPDPPAG